MEDLPLPSVYRVEKGQEELVPECVGCMDAHFDLGIFVNFLVFEFPNGWKEERDTCKHVWRAREDAARPI